MYKLFQIDKINLYEIMIYLNFTFLVFFTCILGLFVQACRNIYLELTLFLFEIFQDLKDSITI